MSSENPLFIKATPVLVEENEFEKASPTSAAQYLRVLEELLVKHEKRRTRTQRREKCLWQED